MVPIRIARSCSRGLVKRWDGTKIDLEPVLTGPPANLPRGISIPRHRATVRYHRGSYCGRPAESVALSPLRYTPNLCGLLPSPLISFYLHLFLVSLYFSIHSLPLDTHVMAPVADSSSTATIHYASNLGFPSHYYSEIKKTEAVEENKFLLPVSISFR